MTTLQILIVCATAVMLALIIATVRLMPLLLDAFGQTHPANVGASVVVHTLDGRSLRGTVADEGTGDAIELHDASYLDEGKAQPLGGVVRVPAGNVAFVQALST